MTMTVAGQFYHNIFGINVEGRRLTGRRHGARKGVGHDLRQRRAAAAAGGRRIPADGSADVAFRNARRKVSVFEFDAALEFRIVRNFRGPANFLHARRELDRLPVRRIRRRHRFTDGVVVERQVGSAGDTSVNR